MMPQVKLEFRKGEPLAVIMAFRGEHKFLSNFERAEVFGYPTNENAYMAWKTTNDAYRRELRELRPDDAKALSETDAFKASHRRNYSDLTRIQAMLKINREKYRVHGDLANRFLDTGDATLIEGTTWDDKFFGTCMKTGEGMNYMGRILMTIRDELRVVRGLPRLFDRPLLPVGIF
jgi:predicted NAD-dependent protein-ADP-ribosyltransferase YbiA (DUF1768 family)